MTEIEILEALLNVIDSWEACRGGPSCEQSHISRIKALGHDLEDLGREKPL